MSTLSEQEFRMKSDEALEGGRQALLPMADEHEFEVELQAGILNVLFEEPRDAKFVISPNAPVRQIWVSAMSRSFKLSWDAERQLFALNGESLDALLARLSQEFLAS
jgi:CyaY protein